MNNLSNQPTTKSALMHLSKCRLESLELLYDNDFFDIVVSDFGYPIEFGLKAAICARYYDEEYPPPSHLLDENGKKIKYFKHKANELIELCGLTDELDSMLYDYVEFSAAWNYISSWDVNLRYVRTGNGIEDIASACIESLTLGGVLEWIEENWEERIWIDRML